MRRSGGIKKCGYQEDYRWYVMDIMQKSGAELGGLRSSRAWKLGLVGVGVDYAALMCASFCRVSFTNLLSGISREGGNSM
jgi:hypothetical protein